MVGIRRVKLLVGIFIPIFGFFLMSHNTYAERVRNLTPTSIEYSITPTGTKTTLNIGTLLNTSVQTLQITGNQRLFIRRINFNRAMNLNTESKRTLIIPLVIRTFTPNSNFQNTETQLAYSQFDCPTAEYGTAVYGFRVEKCDIKSANIINLPATGNFDTANGNEWSQNLIMSEYIVDIYIKAVLGNATNTYIDFVDTPMFSFLKSSGTNIIVGWQVGFIGLPYIIEPDIDPVEEELKEQNERENAAIDNINNQSSEDITDASNQQTTSIIGAISSFVSAFQNVQPAQNCNLTLPFPEFLDGDMTVNICQGKNKAPALITIGSSLLLIVTFIPLAFIMLRMIYSEIRSFTNG